jgi:thioredoxin 1
MNIKLLNLTLLLSLLLFVAGCNEPKGELKAVETPKPQISAKTPTIKPANNIKVTFVELGSVNCMPCKMMQPIMSSIEKKYAGQVTVVFHDVWTAEGKPYGEKYGIRAIPTQIFLDKDGNEYYRHTGFFPEEEIVKILQLRGVK